MQLTLDQFKEYTLAKVLSGESHFAQLLSGPPGVGKTAACYQLADDLERHTDKSWPVIDVRLSQMDAVDLRGVPYVADGVTRWAPPHWLPQAHSHGKHGILLIDEIFHGAPSTQAGAMQLVHEHRLGDAEVPPGWVILAATNRDCDRAGISRTQNSALDNRFQHHEIILDFNTWEDWALNNGVLTEVVAFFSLRQDLLHEYPDGNIDKGIKAYCSPRTAVEASSSIKLDLRRPLERAVLEGTIGQGVTTELLNFLGVIREIPLQQIRTILDRPADAPLTDEPSSHYAVTAMLANMVTTDNLGAGIEYTKRISDDYAVLLVRLATKRNPELVETRAYLDFKQEHKTENV